MVEMYNFLNKFLHRFVFFYAPKEGEESNEKTWKYLFRFFFCFSDKYFISSALILGNLFGLYLQQKIRCFCFLIYFDVSSLSPAYFVFTSFVFVLISFGDYMNSTLLHNSFFYIVWHTFCVQFFVWQAKKNASFILFL